MMQGRQAKQLSENLLAQDKIVNWCGMKANSTSVLELFLLAMAMIKKIRKGSYLDMND